MCYFISLGDFKFVSNIMKSVRFKFSFGSSVVVKSTKCAQIMFWCKMYSTKIVFVVNTFCVKIQLQFSENAIFFLNQDQLTHLKAKRRTLFLNHNKK